MVEFGAVTNNDVVAVRRWMWIIASEWIRLSTARIAHMFYCSVLRIEGTFWRMLMPSDSEAETARRAGTAHEKTKCR